MAGGKRKKDYSVYILPILLCILFLIMARFHYPKSEPPVDETVMEEVEPLTLTDQAIENYLYTDGFSLRQSTVLDADGKVAATLAVEKGENGEIEVMTLSFTLPTYIETGNSDVMTGLKAEHDAAASRGETVFLSLFDAVAATDGRIPALKERAQEKLHATLRTGKSSSQSANSWRFTFSLTPGELTGEVHIRFEKVK